ncbi:Acetyl-coenzyme A synthetase-like protein [Dinothrombium tinctorium]|uniref:Acetyl-coenzyme A synthetase n=1 Tax=Dinothrombium tinctorium TaxID=1965070 RepID=A0A443REI1_9ACAR|nr:Acetyl-coenzyme A synthetase-like protein [Dinothrombium tinctorium]
MVVIHPTQEQSQKSFIGTMEKYHNVYEKSIKEPELFWYEVANKFHWEKYPQIDGFLRYNFDIRKGPISIKWMEDGVTNICFNCVDKWVESGFGDRVAYVWNGNECHEKKVITYSQLKDYVCKFANALLSKGIKKGDHVAIYMPVTIELVVAMLACARIGAIHVVVFAGFSANALADRIMDSKCVAVITANGVYRGHKYIPLHQIVEESLEICEKKNYAPKFCIIYNHTENSLHCKKNNKVGRFYWHELLANSSKDCDVVWINSEDPLFVLYTSGSTGKPKGMIHTTGGYMIFSAAVFKYVFNYNEGDVFFCTADLGWITGHTHNVYGALLNGAKVILFDGVPTHPTPSRLWQIIDEHEVHTFYTAPTAIRTLMKLGDEHVTSCSLKSLRILALVGEPIDPESWKWFYKVVGSSRCVIVDTFFQTETAAPMITPLPGCTPLKPGSATLPFFGVEPAILNSDGEELYGPAEGFLVFKRPWPGIARNILGDNDRFADAYFKKFPNYYFTGDGCRRDEDGYYWITGRIDDTVNVSGHLLSTAEVEAVLIENAAIAEAAVVGVPHEIKGQCLYCYVVLKNEFTFDEELTNQLKHEVRTKIGPLADPETIVGVLSLPKTRSGKIVRRILRKLAVKDTDFGDISTLAEDNFVKELLQQAVAA